MTSKVAVPPCLRARACPAVRGHFGLVIASSLPPCLTSLASSGQKAGLGLFMAAVQAEAIADPAISRVRGVRNPFALRVQRRNSGRLYLEP